MTNLVIAVRSPDGRRRFQLMADLGEALTLAESCIEVHPNRRRELRDTRDVLLLIGRKPDVGGTVMKRAKDAPRLRLRLAKLVALGLAPKDRRRTARRLAERIAEVTGDSIDDVLDRACRDAIARFLREINR